MEFKLYPPIIEGTIPAFTDSGGLRIPFSMNRAVGYSEVGGFEAKIKSLNSNTILHTLYAPCNEQDADIQNGVVVFDIADLDLTAGQYYRVQLAYTSKSGTMGYFSTTGITKYIKRAPTLTINNFTATNKYYPHQFNYIGHYSYDDAKVYNEKLYSSRFVLRDDEDKVIVNSGEIIHNNNEDTSSNKAQERFSYNRDLLENKVYTIQYIATTMNGYVCESPKYKIVQRNLLGPLSDKIKLIAELDYDNGRVFVELRNEGTSSDITSGNFILSRYSDEDGWIELGEMSISNKIVTKHLFTDYTVKQGVYYKYSLQQRNNLGNTSGRKISNTIYADFEDLFIYDGNLQLKVKFNPKISSFKTTKSEAKTETIGSQYPFITRNPVIDYKDFPISGLISFQMDENKLFFKEPTQDFDYFTPRGEGWGSFDIRDKFLKEKFIDDEKVITEFRDRLMAYEPYSSSNIALEREFKLQVLDWLNDGQPKLVRSSTEGNYIVRLMNVSLTPNDTLGRLIHTFNCQGYEIAKYNEYSLIKYGFVTLDKENLSKIRYSTADLMELSMTTETKILHYVKPTKDEYDANRTKYFIYEDKIPEEGNKGGYVQCKNKPDAPKPDEEPEPDLFPYNPNISYYSYYDEVKLNKFPVTWFRFSAMAPGTQFYVRRYSYSEPEIYVIGSTGVYEDKTGDTIYSIGIKKEDIQRGTFDYSYLAQRMEDFDIVTQSYVYFEPCRQIIGDYYKNELKKRIEVENTNNLIEYLQDIKNKILAYYSIKFVKRDIRPLYVWDDDDGIRHFYLNENDKNGFTFDEYNQYIRAYWITNNSDRTRFYDNYIVPGKDWSKGEENLYEMTYTTLDNIPQEPLKIFNGKKYRQVLKMLTDRFCLYKLEWNKTKYDYKYNENGELRYYRQNKNGVSDILNPDNVGQPQLNDYLDIYYDGNPRFFRYSPEIFQAVVEKDGQKIYDINVEDKKVFQSEQVDQFSDIELGAGVVAYLSYQYQQDTYLFEDGTDYEDISGDNVYLAKNNYEKMLQRYLNYKPSEELLEALKEGNDITEPYEQNEYLYWGHYFNKNNAYREFINELTKAIIKFREKTSA